MHVYYSVLLVIYIAGISCENNFSSQIQHTQPENGESATENLKGSDEMKTFGIVSQSKWNNTDDVFTISIRNAKCYDLEQCLSPVRAHPSSSKNACNFIILDSGEVVKMLGWDRESGSEISICLETKDGKLTTVVLEATAFLFQVGVSLGRVKKSFRCYRSDISLFHIGKVLKLIKWCHSYMNIFDKDLSVYRTPIVGDVETVFRSDWDPMEPARDLDTIKERAEVVEVHLTYLPCSSLEGCTNAAQYLRREHTKEHGDLFVNFLLGGDGRVYEGLGWNSSKIEKIVQFHFLLNSEDSAPKKMSLSAFSLLIREGVRLGKISESYRLDLSSINNGTVAEEIQNWISWSRKILAEKSVASASSTAGEETHEVIKSEALHQMRHPIGHVLFTTSSGDVDGVPFVRSLKGKSIRSAKQVRSNFYFAGDEVAYEGLGWNRTATEDEVVFEFLISDRQALPSNQSMLVSTFLMREGVKRGFLRADHELTVAEHTSIEFENMVRFWDGRVRG